MKTQWRPFPAGHPSCLRFCGAAFFALVLAAFIAAPAQAANSQGCYTVRSPWRRGD